MAIQLKSTTRDSMATQIANAIGAGGFLDIYDATGGVPAAVATAISTQVKLVHEALSGTPSVSGQVLTIVGSQISANAIAGGTAAFFRVTDSAGNAIVQGLCATSGGDLNLITLTISNTQPVQINSLTLTMPGA